MSIKFDRIKNSIIFTVLKPGTMKKRTGYNFSKKQVESIIAKAQSLLPTVTDWKQACNYLHYAQVNGKQLQFSVDGIYYAPKFTIMKCMHSGKIVMGWKTGCWFDVETGKSIGVLGGMVQTKIAA